MKSSKQEVKPGSLHNLAPLWLRRLGLIKDELLGYAWPQSAEQGFRQVADLSGTTLLLLKQEIREAHPHASEQEVQKLVREMMARQVRTELRRRTLWDKERARFFR